MSLYGLPEVEPLGNGQVLLRGRALVRVAGATKSAVAVLTRRDGGRIDPELSAVLQVLEAEARAFLSILPQAEAAPRSVLAESVIEPVTTEEAAMILEMTPRNVRYLAPQLGGQRIRGRWVFDRATVVATADERRAA